MKMEFVKAGWKHEENPLGFGRTAEVSLCLSVQGKQRKCLVDLCPGTS